jgi:hypothetical protein
VKNGPALGGYGAVAMNAALTASMTKLPEQLRKTLTWDRGKELSGHALFALETGTKVFFADPHSPWQRPTNENTNGLLRQYFPKGTDLSRWSAEDLEAVAHALNNRPRKILGWKTPAEVFEEQLRSFNNPVLQRPLELATYTELEILLRAHMELFLRKETRDALVYASMKGMMSAKKRSNDWTSDAFLNKSWLADEIARRARTTRFRWPGMCFDGLTRFRGLQRPAASSS